MGKLKPNSFAADIQADSSWSTEQGADQLTDAVRNYLIQQQTKYVSHSEETYHHPTEQPNEFYYKVITYRIGRQKQREKVGMFVNHLIKLVLQYQFMIVMIDLTRTCNNNIDQI